MPSKYGNQRLLEEIPQTKEAQMMQTQETLGKIDEAILKVDQQIAKEYSRYEEAKQKGDVVAAKRALKIFLFMSKMKNLSIKFREMLERVENIQRLFDILADTNEIFTNLMSVDNQKTMSSMKKNLKKFAKQIKKYEADMEGMLDMLDKAFDTAPNPIVVFFKKLFGKKMPDPAEELAKMEADAQMYMQNRPTGEAGTTTTTTTTTTTPTGAAPTGDDGTFIIH